MSTPIGQVRRKLLRWAKAAVLWAYVYLWAPPRNFVRALLGRAHTVVLNYHRVDDGFNDAVTVGTEQFRRQMRALKRRYKVIDMDTFLSQRGRRRWRTSAVVTFDDGYADNYEAAKVLRDERLPCTFFVSTGIVGTEKPFPHDIQRLGRRVPALSWSQIREMAEWGFRFGNHTAGHRNLGQSALEEARAEIERAAGDLRRELGPTGSEAWLAYPHGKPTDISDEARQLLPDIGIRFCFSAYGGTNRPDFDPMDILRQGVNHEFSELAFRALVEGWSVRF